MDRTSRITKFGLRNFKSFHYLEDIELRPLTVLVGANSAGKSSLLQSLLLLKQTSQADRFSGVLKFDGDWTHLGNFANIISDFDLKKKLEFRITGLTSYSDVSQEDHSFLFPKLRFPKHIGTILSKLNVNLTFTNHSEAEDTVLENLSVISTFPQTSTKNGEMIVEVSEGGKKVTGINLPVPNFFSRPKEPFEIAGARMDKFWLEQILYRDSTDEPPGPRYGDMPLRIAIPLRDIKRQITEKLEYLGPVRADPRPFYPVAETPSIGPRGEDTVPFLLRHQKNNVRYAPAISSDLRESTLLEATNHWLRRMKVTDCLTIEPVASIAYVASIQAASSSRRSVNLDQVGFGISQLLPVLVMGLKGPNDGLLLLEQPEIHLHPRLQAELAEFLLCTAQVGKTVIVETHSDHLINRLRRCIAEDETGKLADMVSILFVHPGTAENPGSYVEPLQIDENGLIVNWPPDFLSESANESLAILRAGQKKMPASSRA